MSAYLPTYSLTHSRTHVSAHALASASTLTDDPRRIHTPLPPAVPQALAPANYVRKQMQSHAEAIGLAARLPRGAALVPYIRSALAFLSMTREDHAARTQAPRLAMSQLALPRNLA